MTISLPAIEVTAIKLMKLLVANIGQLLPRDASLAFSTDNKIDMRKLSDPIANLKAKYTLCAIFVVICIEIIFFTVAQIMCVHACLMRMAN